MEINLPPLPARIAEVIEGSDLDAVTAYAREAVLAERERCAADKGDGSYLCNEDLQVRDAFEAWAKSHLGQGYSLARDEGSYTNSVTRWAYKAYAAAIRGQQETK